MTALPLTRSDAVTRAQAENRPIVALESTIITHGMPWPQNLEMAQKVEATVRAHGAEPATIAVLDGTLHIGLEPAPLEQLAQTRGAAARAAGIDVFATGGIGGVHRGAEHSFDISADLQELSASAVTVVAAGAKAILDLPKTLEVLETLGVPVIAYGQDAFPAFWSRVSKLKAAGCPLDLFGHQADRRDPWNHRKISHALPVAAHF